MLALIDLDGTLVDRRAGFLRWAEWFAAEEGLDEGGRAWLVEQDLQIPERGAFFAAVVAELGLPHTAEELWMRYRRELPGLVPLFPGIAEALTALRRAGWRLWIASNGKADNQVGKIRRTGLDRLVDGWSVSEEVGDRKPDAAFWEAALTAAFWQPGEETWMVGDSPDADILGASVHGLRTCWISAGRAWPGGGAPPDLAASTTAQALALLQTRPAAD